MELIIMLSVSIAPFILTVQSISQNHWIVTFTVESDQKAKLLQTHRLLCVLQHLPYTITSLIWSLQYFFPPEYAISDLY